jgi:hypothetical protein
MSNKRTELAKLMDKRGVSAIELSEVTRIPVEDCEAFRAGDSEPDPEAAWHIARALDGSYRAELAFSQLARRKTVTLAGDGAAQLGIKPTWPKDGADVKDGGRPE